MDIAQNFINDWQEITDILAQVCDVPAALIMKLSGPDIEVLVSSQNEGNPYSPGDKEYFEDSGLYCETVIKSKNKLLVPDALADEKWKDNPDVKLNMISYLGFPVCHPDGKPFGTICILDTKRNEYSSPFEKLMLKFRDILEKNLELIHMNQTLGDKNRQLTDYLVELQVLRGIVPICAYCKAIRDKEDQWRPVEHYLVKNNEADFSHGICPICMDKHYPDYKKQVKNES